MGERELERDYSQMTEDDFRTILEEIVDGMLSPVLLAIGDVESILREELNNEILDKWAEANPDKALPKEIKEAIESVRKLSRGALEQILETASIQCYDSEEDYELREALIENLKDKTIDPALVLAEVD